MTTDADESQSATFVGTVSRFLTQDVIETTVQAGADAGCRLRFGQGRIDGTGTVIAPSTSGTRI